MADPIRIDIAGDRQVGLRFAQFPGDLYDDLRNEIDDLSIQLAAMVQAAAPNATGKLRNQVRHRLFADKERITGYVDIASGDAQDHRKAAALEYGSKGKPVAVSAHAMRLDHFWSEQLSSPLTVLTKAYKRTPNIAEHAFERGPLAAIAPQVQVRLNAVVEQAVAKANA